MFNWNTTNCDHVLLPIYLDFSTFLNPSFVEREVDFLGKCTVSEVQGRNVQADRNATAELTEISIIHDIMHNLLYVQFLHERKNGKHSIENIRLLNIKLSPS